LLEAIDITGDSLREQGYTLKKEGLTIALYFNNHGASHRFSLYKTDWNKTTRQLEKKLVGAGFEQSIISTILEDMSANYNILTNGVALTAKGITLKQEQGQRQDRIEMTAHATRATDCSMEEWRVTVKIKYDNLKKLTEEKIPGLWTPLEFMISIKCILNVRNITLPVIGIILGPPSSLKSVAVNMPKGARDTFTVDSFSPKSFVSHNSNLSEKQLQEIDLLPKIKNKLFMVPELSPLFTSREEDLENIIGMITRIGDGEGYTSASGSKGVRGYEGPIMFCWVGAAVDIPYKIHRMLSRLGPKLYFFRMPISVVDEDSLLEEMRRDDFKDRVREVKKALFDYFEYFESCPNMEMDSESGIPKLDWNAQDRIQEQAQRCIIYLAELLAYLRGTVSTYETEDTQGLNYGYNSRNVENVKRATTQLHNLSKAHALSQGREYVTKEDDLPFIIKVVLSGAASIERVKVLNLLLSGSKEYKYAASQIAEEIGTSVNTAKRTMAEFRALGLVEFEELGNNGEPLALIRLKDDLDWFFTQEFRDLRGDYMPGDFKDFLVKKNRKNLTQNTEADSNNDFIHDNQIEYYSVGV
jgi:DNA-binding transcriptional ArsR family regulator